MQPFSGVPRVFATVTGEDFDDTFAVSAQLVTSSYAVININRVNGIPLLPPTFLCEFVCGGACAVVRW
jgi:hypothetical protein